MLNKYNVDTNSLCLKNFGVNQNEIQENVVIAPFYSIETMSQLDENIKMECLFQKYYSIINVTLNNKKFTYIKCNMCAGNIAEVLLSLYGSNCKNLFFIGSAGSLKTDIKMGEIVLPKESIIGDGTCRYFNKMKDLLGKISKPSEILLNRVKMVLKEFQLKFKTVQNYSVDTMAGQFLVFNQIMESGAQTIDMEVSSFFYIAKKLKFNAVAMLNISDNSIQNKNIYKGRTEEDKQAKKYTQNLVFPKILINLLLK